jgi:hypothetical protein
VYAELGTDQTDVNNRKKCTLQWVFIFFFNLASLIFNLFLGGFKNEIPACTYNPCSAVGAGG